MNWIPLVVSIIVFIVFMVLLVIFVINPSSKDTSSSDSDSSSSSPILTTTRTPTQRPFIRGASRIPVGVKPNFASVKTLAATNNLTFNYVNSPLQTGSTGYLLYNNKSNMFDWGFSMPLQFTHARLDGKIFEFENPNSSDTYGAFVNDLGYKLTSQTPNFFTSKLELGTFF